MSNHHHIRNAIAGVAAVACLLAYPAKSQTDEADRLQKLEQAVKELQQRNAQLESEVKSLKKDRDAFAAAAAAPAEGPTKKKVTYDGKTYIEKEVPVEKSAADKWKLSLPLTELEIYGDVRLRYEYRGGEGAENTNIPHDWQERERERYRLRLGLRGTLADDWFFGVRLETSQNPRSTNVTFGDDTSTTSAGGGGPFSKGSDGVNVGQAYVGYKGFKDITLTGGKMPNPLVNTWMVWDPDINPEGLAEQWKHTFKFGGGSGLAQSYGKDGKNVVAAAAPTEEPYTLDLFVNFAQFIYDDVPVEDPLGPRSTFTGNGTRELVPNTDAWLLAWQAGAKFTFPNQLYVQAAPTLYNYTGNGDTFDVHFQGGAPGITNAASLAQNQTGINSLLVFDMPMEVGWKLGSLPMRVFGDFAVNLDGGDRATAAGRPDKSDQKYAFQAGIGAGSLKKKGQWEVDVFWQYNQQYSLDPNLIDNDVFDARLNMQGVGVRAGYMFSDAVWLYLTYVHGWRIDDSLGTGGANDIAINPLDRYNILQADLNVKF